MHEFAADPERTSGIEKVPPLAKTIRHRMPQDTLIQPRQHILRLDDGRQKRGKLQRGQIISHWNHIIASI
ncbi:hypothetical protein RsS62_26070 [Rhizobium dioscoreae]|nr:hypothetical protein RsS62_26070 [Rhizobium dioscoreae]